MSRTVQLTLEHEHDFWVQVDRSDEGGCWIWEGSKDHKGYGFMWIGGERLGAHRLSWILHHNQPLESYKQVRRTCRSKVCCVRPGHQKRNDRTYDSYAKSRKNAKFTVVRPPVRGETDAPRAETIRALAGSYEELRELRKILGTLTGALPQRDRADAGRHKKTHTSVEKLAAMVEGLNDDMVEWRAAVDERLRRIERVIERTLTPGPKETEAPAPTVAAKDSEPEAVQKEETKSEPANNVGGVLMTAFQGAIGGPDEPVDEDYEALVTVFDIALSEESDSRKAVDLFGSWLTAFQELTARHPDLERTPRDFAREASARRLEP